jgi:uncharacterized membrane protein YeaQ/YmgE (transglycosylase-associated protein family)
MGVLVWFAIGAAIGLTVARVMPVEFPGDRSGAAAAGAMGAFLAGALFASVIGHQPKEFAASTLPAAALGAGLFTFLIGRVPRPRDGGRSRRSPRVERG